MYGLKLTFLSKTPLKRVTMGATRIAGGPSISIHLRDVSKICVLQLSRSLTSHARWPELLITLECRLIVNQLVLTFKAFFRIFDGTLQGRFSDKRTSELLFR